VRFGAVCGLSGSWGGDCIGVGVFMWGGLDCGGGYRGVWCGFVLYGELG
jgi:hypothetical protein